jgi:hypothetical protein
MFQWLWRHGMVKGWAMSRRSRVARKLDLIALAALMIQIVDFVRAFFA